MILRRLFGTALVLTLLQACSSDSSDNSPNPAPPAIVEEATTIVDTAIADGSFTTLVAALEATGLDATLADETGNFTVFAPTDDAFALLGQETIDALLADTDTLSAILTYHVLDSAVDAETAIASAGEKFATVNGAEIALSLDNSSLLVNLSTVTATDIVTDNGIIHVIDAVLAPPAPRGETTGNIVETAVAAGTFTSLVAALQATGLDTTLADESSRFTVFAPTDDAFAMIDAATIEALFDNPDVLSSILLQHVVTAEVPSVDAFTLNGNDVETASGALIPLSINSATDTLTFGGANVTVTDIYTTNGVIHVIDTVIVADVEIPAPAASIVDVARDNGSFNTLVAALEATDLDVLLGDTDQTFTVFAPTDAAFALLGADTIDALLADPTTLSNILTYHVIADAEILQDAAVTVAQSGDNKVEMANGQEAALSFAEGSLFINASNVSAADVMADNGVIHVIDQVILPPAEKVETTETIVDLALANENLSTLVTALQTADLVTTLADETTSFTVFAPTNAAFDKVEDGALSGLLSDTSALSDVLLTHVIIGSEIASLDAYAANGSAVPTASGDSVNVALTNFAGTASGENDEVAYDAENQRLVGGANSSNPGFTLYTFENDLGLSSSACNNDCALNWPPVTSTDGAVANIPGLTLISREDGSEQVAFKGRPLYFFSGDEAAGDINGNGVSDAWFTADQQQVELEIQGSGVETVDLYGSNGVIHLIDTVILN
ncbi:MAG: fasciclin domain-containing protein [Pseudomonadales bacterium]|nr:fasciclin domain-containing protein [Pseudomonadales bacterium]